MARIPGLRLPPARRLFPLPLLGKTGNRKLTCAHCGRRVHDIHAVYERKLRDLPVSNFRPPSWSGATASAARSAESKRARNS